MLTRMLDSDMSMYVMRGRAKGLVERFNALAEELCFSTITLGELHHGVERSRQVARNLQALRHFVAHLTVLPLDERAAVHHGQIWAELETNCVGLMTCRLAGTLAARGSSSRSHSDRRCLLFGPL
jgi:tRNA(fMet)-specific endonuclease VapC